MADVHSPNPAPRSPRVLAVIPARWESSRFPGKVLAPLAGRPVLAWVIDAARGAGRVDEVVVATDAERVAEAAAVYGVDAVMTAPDHPSGSDRIGEAIAGRPADVVVNVQGDEALIPSASIDVLVDALLSRPRAAASTLACPLADEERADPNVVKVVAAANGRALYFSRADVPGVHPMGHRRVGSRRHVGLYAYRRAALEAFLSAEPGLLELQEGLEQLRMLELGLELVVEDVPEHPAGVDTPEDLARCERVLARRDSAV